MRTKLAYLILLLHGFLFPLIGVQAGSLRALKLLVRDSKGEPVSGLGAGDFEIRIAGKICPIQSCLEADEAAVVGIIVDTSASMGGRVKSPAHLRQMVSAFLEAGHPANRYFLFEAADQARLRQDFTNEPARILDALPSQTNRPGSLFKALAQSLEKLRSEPGRRFLLVISEGMENPTDADKTELSRALSTLSVQILGLCPLESGELSLLALHSSELSYLIESTRGIMERTYKSEGAMASFGRLMRRVYTIDLSCPVEEVICRNIRINGKGKGAKKWTFLPGNCLAK